MSSVGSIGEFKCRRYIIFEASIPPLLYSGGKFPCFSSL
jgi:hypothetical protein